MFSPSRLVWNLGRGGTRSSRGAAQALGQQLLNMVERRFRREPFTGHEQPRARRLGVRPGQRLERRDRARQIAAGKRGLGGADRPVGSGVRWTIDAADRHQATQPGEGLLAPIRFAGRFARHRHPAGQLGQAFHQNGATCHAVSSGFGERLGSGGEVGIPSEPDERIELGRKRPGLLDRLAHLSQQQRQHPVGPKLGLVLRLCLALQRRHSVREIAFDLAEAGELLLHILGSGSFARHPRSGLGFDRSEPLIELLHTGPNRTEVGFAGGLELIDAAPQRA